MKSILILYVFLLCISSSLVQSASFLDTYRDRASLSSGNYHIFQGINSPLSDLAHVWSYRHVHIETYESVSNNFVIYLFLNIDQYEFIDFIFCVYISK